MTARPGSYRHLCVEPIGAVQRVTLARAEVYNALNKALLDELTAVASGLARDDSVRAVILTGAGRAFCAGADLSPGAFPAVAGETRGEATRRLLIEHFNPAVLAWTSLPQPLIVAVNGVAAGGGVGLALLGDIVVAASTASFQSVFVPKLALAPDLGAAWHMRRLAGAGRALGLSLLGDVLSAERAVQWGLAWESVDEAALPSRALELAQRLAAGPALATRRVKSLLRGEPGATLDAQLALEAQLQGELADHPDHAEGIRAFVEKRRPQFS
ncbi:MAG: enoyl-CoA hydratase-related protein [Steroidobacteraceae bacterium]|jgi:2-(1,2-epoxy-1,2-dihydrophenyl)acetyl-CoA isomerase|nr:enoyl-CoA hydratase-related protein [Steroidobacteraceae bacterium]